MLVAIFVQSGANPALFHCKGGSSFITIIYSGGKRKVPGDPVCIGLLTVLHFGAIVHELRVLRALDYPLIYKCIGCYGYDYWDTFHTLSSESNYYYCRI